MEDRYEWNLRLQDMLEQTVKNAYQGTWKYSYHSNQGMACDIPDIGGKFEVERFEHVVEEEELRVYARISKNITEPMRPRVLFMKCLVSHLKIF